jgi:hypothetical protein
MSKFNEQAQPGLSETKPGVSLTAGSRISLALNPGYAPCYFGSLCARISSL